MRKYLLLLILMYPVLACLGQDTLLFKEVEINAPILWNRDSTYFVPVLKKEKIKELQSEDVGQLLQLFSGVQVKSYGGLGGLKNVSVRGLGGQHTAFVVNGVAIPSDQTGQVNFGTIQADNIEEISLNLSDNDETPASAKSFGSSVQVKIFESSFSKKENALIVGQKYGSFGQSDSYITYKKGDVKERYFVAIGGKYRQFGGKYHYLIANGSTFYEGVRENNRYQDLNVNVGVGVKWKNDNSMVINYQKLWVNQELPGPVILYAPGANQDLVQKNDQIQFNLKFKGTNRINGNLFGLSKWTSLRYVDSNYLNSIGILESNYQQISALSGLNLNFKPTRITNFSFSGELQFTQLSSSEYKSYVPQRLHHFYVFSLTQETAKIIDVTGQLSTQVINERAETFKNLFYINPSIEIRTKPLFKKQILFYASFRNSFRMPTFNELYYNKIGNLNLRPERANQFALGLEYSKSKENFEHLLRCNAYHSYVQDKIVAVPTMNLFLWTILNIDRVTINGFDVSYSLSIVFEKKHKVNFGINYTLQSVQDRTDVNTPTYRHQIAYMPLHSGNSDISYYYKNYGIRIGVFANDKRYSLNENIESNKVKGFAVLDATLLTYLKIKGKSKINLTFSCKNLLNQSYAVIRNYVMPGRNFLISLSYAFN